MCGSLYYFHIIVHYSVPYVNNMYAEAVSTMPFWQKRRQECTHKVQGQIYTFTPIMG
jgi:hypothetical protein